MKTIPICFTACAALLTGCNRAQDAKVAELSGQVKVLQESQQQAELRNETLQEQVTDLDGKLRGAQAEADALRLRLEKAGDSVADAKTLAERIKQLEAEIERLKSQPVAATPTEPPLEQPAPATPPADEPRKPDAEVVKQLEDLLPLVKGGDDASLETALSLIATSDKQTRDEFIAAMQQWVKDEPEEKKARLALAAALGARFQDLTNPMKMGELAGEMKNEAEHALEIDPEYYDAVHFLAILRVNYPTFTAEFKEANVSLDKAVSMQEQMTWQDRFAEIYAAYGMWFRMQKKHADALAWVQKGLDKAPRDQGLLDEQKAIEDASSKAED